MRMQRSYETAWRGGLFLIAGRLQQMYDGWQQMHAGPQPQTLRWQQGSGERFSQADSQLVWLAEQGHWLHFDVTGGCAQVGRDDLPVHESRFGCGFLRFSAGHFEAMRVNATSKSRDCMDMDAYMGAGPEQRDRKTERRGARWADMEDSDPGEDMSVDSFDLARPVDGQGPTVLERMNFQELLSSRQTRAAALRACMTAFKIELCEMVAQCEQLVVEDEGWKMFMLDPCCRELPMPFYLLQVFVAKVQMGSLLSKTFRGTPTK